MANDWNKKTFDGQIALCKIFAHACRSMNEAQPEAIQELYKMIRKFYWRTNRER